MSMAVTTFHGRQTDHQATFPSPLVRDLDYICSCAAVWCSVSSCRSLFKQHGIHRTVAWVGGNNKAQLCPPVFDWYLGGPARQYIPYLGMASGPSHTVMRVGSVAVWPRMVSPWAIQWRLQQGAAAGFCISIECG